MGTLNEAATVLVIYWQEQSEIKSGYGKTAKLERKPARIPPRRLFSPIVCSFVGLVFSVVSFKGLGYHKLSWFVLVG